MTAPHGFKIVVAGPFAAGKTTFIRSISDKEVVGTEAETFGDEASVKASTTVGMEFGSYTVPNADPAVELRLFGVPGQERFSFMWDIVAAGMDGLCFIVDATKPETWAEAAIVKEHFDRFGTTPALLAVNRALGRPDLVDEVRTVVPMEAHACIACDVTDPGSARDTLIELLLLVLDHLDEEEDEPDVNELDAPQVATR